MLGMRNLFCLAILTGIIVAITGCGRDESGSFDAEEGKAVAAPKINLSSRILFAFDLSSGKLYYKVYQKPFVGPVVCERRVIYQSKDKPGGPAAIYGWDIDTGKTKEIFKTNLKRGWLGLVGRKGRLAWFQKGSYPESIIVCFDIEKKAASQLDFDLTVGVSKSALDIEGNYVAASINGKLVVFELSTGRYREIELKRDAYRIGLAGGVAVFPSLEKETPELVFLNVEDGALAEVPFENAGSFSRFSTGGGKVAWVSPYGQEKKNASITVYDVSTRRTTQLKTDVWTGSIQKIRLGERYLAWMHNNGEELYACELATGNVKAVHEIIKPFIDALKIEDPHGTAEKLGADAQIVFRMDNASLSQDGDLIAWQAQPLIRVPVGKK